MHADTLLQRRHATLGSHSPLFYDEPLHIVSGSGVWLTAADGRRYLDCYNNVAQIGHAHPRVTAAATEQLQRLNVHTRYLNERVVEFSELLLSTVPDDLDRVAFGNSGSEANELALRIAAQVTGNSGVIVSDFSYHGTTAALAGMTTGIRVAEPLNPNVRTIRIPDLSGAGASAATAEAALDQVLAEVDAAIASLRAAGYGIAAGLFDALFSNEGLPLVPERILTGISERIREAGGLMIADEVQSGYGRTGTHLWGFDSRGFHPDLVTLGKPMGNGHPVSAVITRAALLETFGARNAFFNTFAGNPVSAAIAEAVLRETIEQDLPARAHAVAEAAAPELDRLVDDHDCLIARKGTGTFFGLEVVRNDASSGGNAADAGLAREIVEGVKRRGVLISRTGRDGNVLKIRPPLAFDLGDLPVLLDALAGALTDVSRRS